MNKNEKIPEYKPEMTFIKICLILICIFSFTTCASTCAIEKTIKLMKVY